MNKLLVTFNTCGISGKENTDHYIKVIHQLLDQDFDDYRIVLSSCLNSDQTRKQLEQEFSNAISYNYIDEVLPIVVTFNDTVLESVKNYGNFEGYLYVESGLDFISNKYILQELYDCMKLGPYSIVSGMIDTDNGYKEHNLDITNTCGYVKIPIGKAVNGHIHIFSNQILQYYNRCWPDIFGSHSNESVFTFLASALKTNWVLCTKSLIHHIEEMDGPSSGFSPLKWVQQGGQTYNHPFIIPSILDRLVTYENWKFGLGYEEYRSIMMHRPDQFNENGFCVNDQLKEICKTKLFLQPNEFNYNNINHQYIK